MVAKAFGRMGTSYQKKDDLTNAIKFYEKSLTEHRTPDILEKLRAVSRPPFSPLSLSPTLSPRRAP